MRNITGSSVKGGVRTPTLNNLQHPPPLLMLAQMFSIMIHTYYQVQG